MKINIHPSIIQTLGDLAWGEVFNYNGMAYMLIKGAGENSTAVASVELASGKVVTFSRHENDFRRIRDVEISGVEI